MSEEVEYVSGLDEPGRTIERMRRRRLDGRPLICPSWEIGVVLAEIDRLRGELAGQRARAEEAERERDKAREIARSYLERAHKAERDIGRAASPPRGGAGEAADDPVRSALEHHGLWDEFGHLGCDAVDWLCTRLLEARAELAGQRARAEEAERERDVARRLAQQEYHHRMRAEQAASPPPADAAPSALAAELREWAGAMEDSGYSPEYVGLLRRAADAIGRAEEAEWDLAEAQVGLQAADRLVRAINAMEGGKVSMMVKMAKSNLETALSSIATGAASPPPADAGVAAEQYRMIAERIVRGVDGTLDYDAKDSDCVALVRRLGELEAEDVPHDEAWRRSCVEFVEREIAQAVARAARPAAPAAVPSRAALVVVGNEEIHLFSDAGEGRAFLGSRGDDEWSCAACERDLVWHPAPAAPAGPGRGRGTGMIGTMKQNG